MQDEHRIPGGITALTDAERAPVAGLHQPIGNSAPSRSLSPRALRIAKPSQSLLK